MIAHQASCVAVGERALLIEGAPGSGKSSLALALIDRGARLIGDDGVLLEAREGQLLAHPHSATRGLIEVRNLGVLTLPVCDGAPVALMLVLDPEAPRFVDGPERRAMLEIAIPVLRLTPHDALLPVKAGLALERYGLATPPLPSALD